MSDDPKHVGLPVAGYVAQSADKVALVNNNKLVEEAVLRLLDQLAELPDVDKRWLSIGRTEIEKGFMAINRSVFRPARVEGDLNLQISGLIAGLSEAKE